jgi:hypothetical protein
MYQKNISLPSSVPKPNKEPSNLLDADFLLGYVSTLKMEAIHSCVMLHHIHTMQQYIPEDAT